MRLPCAWPTSAPRLRRARSPRRTASSSTLSGKLEVAQTRSAELQGRLQEQARQHAAALRMADERTAAATRALAEANGKLIDLTVLTRMGGHHGWRGRGFERGLDGDRFDRDRGPGRDRGAGDSGRL